MAERLIYTTVVACTNKAKGAAGFSAFIVEKGTPGLTLSGKKKTKWVSGLRLPLNWFSKTAEFPRKNLLSKEGMGFIVAMKTLDRTRPGVAAQALGIAQGAFDEAIKYSRERVQFGQPISSFQAVQHIMADMAIQIEASRALVYTKHADLLIPVQRIFPKNLRCAKFWHQTRQ